jgi:hypothetical protein
MESIGAVLAQVLTKVSPEFIAAFLASAFTYLKPLVTRVLSVAGLSSVSLVGIHALNTTLATNVEGYFNSLPANVLAMAGIMKLDIAFSLIASASIVKFSLRGWDKTTDSISQTTFNLPSGGDDTPTLPSP